MALALSEWLAKLLPRKSKVNGSRDDVRPNGFKSLPNEIILNILHIILAQNNLSDFENLVKAYPHLNSLIMVVGDSSHIPQNMSSLDHYVQLQRDIPMLINLPKSQHISLHNYSFLRMSERSVKLLKVFCFRFCDSDDLFRLNTTSSCEYARHLSYDTCVLFSCDKNSQNVRTLLKQHCDNAHVPVLREAANMVRGRTCLVDPDHAGPEYSGAAEITRYNFYGYAGMIAGGPFQIQNCAKLAHMNVYLEGFVLKSNIPTVYVNAGGLRTLCISFSGTVAPNISLQGVIPSLQLRYGGSRRYRGLDDSHLMITNRNWSLAEPFGKLPNCFGNEFHRQAIGHSKLPDCPSFHNIFLEGLPDMMVPLIHWPVVQNFYWKRLSPQPGSQQHYVNLHLQPDINVSAPSLRKLKIFSHIDENGSSDFPQFSLCTYLKTLTLVSLKGSTGTWDINALLANTERLHLSQVSIVNYEKELTPVLEANDVHLFRRSVEEMVLWGHSAGFIDKFTTEAGAVFDKLELLILDLTSVPLVQHPLDHMENFKHSGSKIGGSTCSASIRLSKYQFPSLRKLRLVAPEDKVAIFGSGVDIELVLPTPKCKSLTVSDIIPVATIVCNGTVTRVRSVSRPRARSHSSWKRSWVTGRFYKKSVPEEKVFTFEEWFDQYQALAGV